MARVSLKLSLAGATVGTTLAMHEAGTRMDIGGDLVVSRPGRVLDLQLGVDALRRKDSLDRTRQRITAPLAGAQLGTL